MSDPNETVFTYASPRLRFGPGAADEIWYDLTQLGARRVLVVTDPGVLAEPLVAEHLAAGRLELALEEYAAWSPGAYLYYPSRTQMLPKLRAFIDFIREHRPPERFLETGTA